MATIVTSIPKAARKTKYNYTELFDGQARRLVKGEDFDVDVKSLRGALYTRKSTLNKGKTDEQKIGLSVHFAVEGDETVAYVQATLPKAAEPVAESAPAEPEAVAEVKAPAKKTAAKKSTPAKRAPVKPNPKVSIEEANEAAKA